MSGAKPGRRHPSKCHCRDLIAQFVSNTFPGPIYPGYAERLAAGTFEVTPSSPGFPVSGKSVGLRMHLAMADVGETV